MRCQLGLLSQGAGQDCQLPLTSAQAGQIVVLQWI
jgi:hypothetical protein